jgi:hypothetical protein
MGERRLTASGVFMAIFAGLAVLALAGAIMFAVRARAAERAYRSEIAECGQMVEKVNDIRRAERAGGRPAQAAAEQFDLEGAVRTTCQQLGISIAGSTVQERETAGRWRQRTYIVHFFSTPSAPVTRQALEDLMEQVETTHPQIRTTQIQMSLNGEEAAQGTSIGFSIFLPPPPDTSR